MTTSMYSHHECKIKDSRSSKFTAHAAVQLQRRLNLRYDAAAATDQLLVELNVKESKELKNLVHSTFPTCNFNLIHVVNAPQMYGMYLLRKEEIRLTHGEYCDKELFLYHVTSKSKALESLRTGLNWRRTRRSKFGRGVSFSDDADYANYYADKFPKEDSRVIIACAVLVNKTHQVSGKLNEGNLIAPPGSVDTTVSPNGRVYVKYNDYDFYPLYFMYYQRSPEHLNESKYFLNNPHNKWQQNNLIMQQQQRERKQAQQFQAQPERDQTQLEFSRKLQEELQKQREREQAQRLHALCEVEQSQKLKAQPERDQTQLEFSRKLQQELQKQREREQAKRQLEVMAQRERMREWRQQELQEQREREQDDNRQPPLEQTHRQQEQAQQREINTKLCCLIL